MTKKQYGLLSLPVIVAALGFFAAAWSPDQRRIEIETGLVVPACQETGESIRDRKII